MTTISGGDKLEKYLNDLAKKTAQRANLRVGFLENAKYPDGLSIAYVAAINEFGASATIPEHQVSVYRNIDEDGDFKNNGKFVKKENANFETTHTVKAYTVTVPPRPFFRTTIKQNEDKWGPQLAKLLKYNDYNTVAALKAIGQHISEQIQESIRTWSDPPNAASTAAGKGFNKPLIDTGDMMRSVNSEVDE